MPFWADTQEYSASNEHRSGRSVTSQGSSRHRDSHRHDVDLDDLAGNFGNMNVGHQHRTLSAPPPRASGFMRRSQAVQHGRGDDGEYEAYRLLATIPRDGGRKVRASKVMADALRGKPSSRHAEACERYWRGVHERLRAIRDGPGPASTAPASSRQPGKQREVRPSRDRSDVGPRGAQHPREDRSIWK